MAVSDGDASLDGGDSNEKDTLREGPWVKPCGTLTTDLKVGERSNLTEITT